MIFRQLFDKESSTYTYLVADERTREAALVDTVRGNVERDLALVEELGLSLVAVLDTHVHADHVTGAGILRDRTGARTYVSQLGGAPCADVLVEGEESVALGDVTVRVLATPGHTSGCVSYLVTAPGEPARVLTGDALLIRGCGRTDFQEGDARTLWRSVHERLFTLEDGTLVYPAHDYRGHMVSTIGEEKRLNPRLGAGATVDSFVAKMADLNLPPPAKIAEAVPANRACGKVEEPPVQAAQTKSSPS